MSSNDGVGRLPRRFRIRWSVVVGLVAVLPVLAIAFSQPADRPLDELVRRDGVFLDPESLEPYTGPVFATADDDPMVVALRASLRDGHYDGPYQSYFDSGAPFEEGTYAMGRRDGPYVAYWEGVDLHERGTYEGGFLTGPRSWYLNGRLVERATYADGVLEGPYERFAEDGTLKSRGRLQNGAPCGTWLEGEGMIEYPSCGPETQ